MVFSSDASLISKMVSRVNATKKVRTPEPVRDANGKISSPSAVEEVITKILQVIDTINAKEERLAMIMDRPLENVVIINEFRDFIMPDSVRQDVSDMRTNDLLERRVPDVKLEISYNEWLDLQSTFRSWFKKDMQSETSNLGQLRVRKSLVDILPCCRIKNNDNPDAYDVRAWDEPFIPVDLNPGVRVLLRSDWFNTSADFILDDYISEWLM